MRRLDLILSAIALFSCTMAYSDTVHVDVMASGADDGTSWTDAYTNLQDAIPSAQTNDDIWVAAGTYYVTGTGGVRTDVFAMRSGVNIYGGFTNGMSSLGERDWNQHEAILSGDINRDDTGYFSNYSDNVYHVLRLTGTNDTVLDGVTIRGGYADGGGDDSRGGGLWAPTASTVVPTILNCVIKDNYATQHGGGAYLPRGGIVSNCTFSGNRVNTPGNDYGGGLSVTGGSAATNRVLDCVFSNNTAYANGGGAYIYSVHAEVRRCVFASNGHDLVPSGGGLQVKQNGQSTILTDSTFVGNYGHRGGGLYQTGAGTYLLDRLKFFGNTCDQDGGGAYLSGSQTLNNWLVVGNEAKDANSGGGGIFWYRTGSDSDLFVNSCTIVSNRGGATTKQGGGIMCDAQSSGGNMFVTNTIFWANLSANGNGHHIYTLDAITLTLGNCVVEGGLVEPGPVSISGGLTNGGTILTTYPDFVDLNGQDEITGTIDDDLRLLTNSPCSDTGSSAGAPSVDIALNPRPQGAGYDIGAYEGAELRMPHVFAADVTVLEGHRDTTNAAFIITLSATSDVEITVGYATIANTASEAEGDYTAVSGSAVFPSGTMTQIVVVAVNGDIEREKDEVFDTTFGESFYLHLTNVINARIDDGMALCIIEDDDNIVFVDKDATGLDDGTTWSNAFVNLQDAFAYASSNVDIWIAEGTYRPSAIGDRSAYFQLPENAKIYGGFAGTEESLRARSYVDYLTILSGDLNGDDTGWFTNRSDNTYHVVYGADGAILDGVDITGGYADQAASPDERGAGVYSLDTTLTLRNCTIRDNYADHFGGGIYHSDAAVPASIVTLVNCAVLGNQVNASGGADGGGGIFISDGNGTNIITDCVISNNAAASNGGGLRARQCSISVRGCTFAMNKPAPLGTPSGAGASVRADAVFRSQSIVDCVFVGNQGKSGGGLELSTVGIYELSRLSFFGNDATTDGGGAFISGTSITIDNSVFSGNTAGDTSHGGGIYWATSLQGSTLSAYNSTFYLNQGGVANGRGGGICAKATSSGTNYVNVTNCIFWLNESKNAGLRGDAISCENALTDVTIGYSDIEGGLSFPALNISGTLTDSGGNTNIFPNFELPAGEDTIPGTVDDNLVLSEGSPCIDAGTFEGAPPYDRNGHKRPSGWNFDMGAYEFEATSLGTSILVW